MRSAYVSFLGLLLLSQSVAAQPSIPAVIRAGPSQIPALPRASTHPRGIAVDASGNLFIASTLDHRVYRVSSAGQLAAVAGNGVQGFSGDGGPATSGSLAYPVGLAVDAGGNLFIADQGNRRVRRVDAATGAITTVAGNGRFGRGGDGGPATSAYLAYPVGVAVDAAGNLFIADQGNQRIRRVDLATGTITTAAGNGTVGLEGDDGPATQASLSYPTGVAIDPAGNLFIADRKNFRVRRVDRATGTITTVAGSDRVGSSGDGGLAIGASLADPFGIALDPAGNLLIADRTSGNVRRVDARTGTIATVVDVSNPTEVVVPFAVAVDAAGNLFVSDFESGRIRRVAAPVPFANRTASAQTPSGHRREGSTTSHAWIRLTALIGILGFLFASILFGLAYRRNLRRVLTCPETGEQVEVKMGPSWFRDPSTFGKPSVHVKACSLWPGRAQCGQACLSLCKAGPAGPLALRTQ